MIRTFVSTLILLVAFTGATSAKGKKWLVYENCELSEDRYFDGDSFSVKASTGYTYVFRLYGVDCPETDKRVPARLKEQAKEFEIEQKDVVKWGKKASRFTRNFLRKPFTVYTQKIKAGGKSKKARYYAIVVNARGERLDEALLAAGLARAYGKGAEWDEPFWGKTKAKLPRRISGKRFMTRLRILENKAKREDQGIWKK